MSYLNLEMVPSFWAGPHTYNMLQIRKHSVIAYIRSRDSLFCLLVWFWGFLLVFFRSYWKKGWKKNKNPRLSATCYWIKHWYENTVFCIFYLITLFSDAISNFSSLTFPKILLALSLGFKWKGKAFCMNIETEQKLYKSSEAKKLKAINGISWIQLLSGNLLSYTTQ